MTPKTLYLIYRVEDKIIDPIEVHESASGARNKLAIYNSILRSAKSKSEYFMRPITLFLKEEKQNED